MPRALHTVAMKSPGLQTLSAVQFQRLSELAEQRDATKLMEFVGVLLRPKKTGSKGSEDEDEE